MIGTAMAILGASAIGAGASLAASSKQASAAKSALAMQGKAQEQLTPFIESGKGAQGLLDSFYGINGSDPALGDNALAAFQRSPDYAFAQKEGMSSLENSAAAKGNLLGGNQIRGAVQFGQGLASQNLNNYLGRLASMSQQGAQSAGMGVSGANAMAQTQMGVGQAQASGLVGAANAVNSGVQNTLLNNYLSQSSFSKPGISNLADPWSGLRSGAFS